jgi:hypothetical protein
MTERERELAARHAELRRRCALQRSVVGAEVTSIAARFGAVDRVAGLVRRTLHPGVLVVGIAAVLAFGGARGLHRIGRVVLLVTAARRLWRVAKTL